MYILEGYSHNSKNPIDIKFCSSGYEACIPENRVVNTPRTYVMHFVVDGKGTYIVDNTTYTIKKGQGFMLCAKKKCEYVPDAKTPWTYYWIGFTSSHWENLVKDLLNLSPHTFSYSKSTIQIVKEIFDLRHAPMPFHLKDMKLLSSLFDLFYDMSRTNETANPKETPQTRYLRHATSYIAGHYRNPLTITEIAEALHIDRTYLFTIFKSQLNISPSQYLIEFRLKKARELMKIENLSAKDIAISVGYTDYSLFSRSFKRYYGLSPKHFRITMKKHTSMDYY